MIQFIFKDGLVHNEFGYHLDLDAIKKKHGITDPIHLLHCVYEDYQRKSHPECIIDGADLILGTRFNVYALPKDFCNDLNMAGQDLLPLLQTYFGTTESTSKKVGK